MSGKHQKKIHRGIRREARKVLPGIVKLINGSPFAWRLRLAIEILFGDVQQQHLMDVHNNVALRGGENAAVGDMVDES